MIVKRNRWRLVASASQRDATLFGQHVEESVWVAATGGQCTPGKLVSVDSRGTDHCDQAALAAGTADRYLWNSVRTSQENSN